MEWTDRQMEIAENIVDNYPRYEAYEHHKKTLQSMNLSSEEYEIRIKEIAKKCGI